MSGDNAAACVTVTMVTVSSKTNAGDIFDMPPMNYLYIKG